MKKWIEQARGIFLGQWTWKWMSAAIPRPSVWVAGIYALAMVMGVLVFEKASEVRSELLQLQPRIGAEAQALLHRANQAPKAFNAAVSVKEAVALLREIHRAQAGLACQTYYTLDYEFIFPYGILLILIGVWALKRFRILGDTEGGWFRETTPGSWMVALLCLAAWVSIAAGAIAAIANIVEDLHCQQALGWSHSGVPNDAAHRAVLAVARRAYSWKMRAIWTNVILAWVLGSAAFLVTSAGRAELGEKWNLVVRASRFAMRARFSILAGAVFTVLLLTGPGEDIVRTIATGKFSGEVTSNVPVPDFNRIGWFGVMLLVLAASCWGWARLVLAVHFARANHHGQGGECERLGIEGRLRRALPIYYGSAPMAAAAAAFAIAPLHTANASSFPTAQFFAGSLAPLLLFFILPLALVVFGADTRSERGSNGPLFWTLCFYAALALAHALFNLADLGLLGFTPLVLFLTALLFFAKGWPIGIFIMPAALLGGAAFHGKLPDAKWPALVLCLIGGVAFLIKRMAPSVDELHIPKSFPAGMLLRLIYSGKIRKKMLDDIEQDHAAKEEAVAMWKASGRKVDNENQAYKKEAEATVHNLSGLLIFCAGLTFLQIVVFVVILRFPEEFPADIGSGAILALGLAGWTTAGSALLFMTQATRFPVLGAAILLAILCSGVMDNHKLHPISKPSRKFIDDHGNAAAGGMAGGGATPVVAAYKKWRALNASSAVPQSRNKAPATHPPCIIVAAEGGGIRAAFWPAIVLGSLQDESLARKKGRPDFASHVFAISGVSGGSFGAAVFTALCANQGNRTKGDIRDKAATMCGTDHLAPTLGALLYPDFVQRFFPIAFLPDRAAAFEGSWEHAWPADAFRNRMNQPFSDLWNEPDPVPGKDNASQWLPALFLNSTMVETGKRAICSNLPICTGNGGQFIDAEDLASHLRRAGPGAGGWQDIRLSTAAHTSARFPLVSPPGRLPSGARVVDGGYFENSGAATGIDVLDVVTKWMDGNQDKTPLIFIFLRYADTPGLSDTITSPKPPQSPPIPDEDVSLYPQTTPLDESGGIFDALLDTRAARGSYSQDAVFHHYLARPNVEVLSFTFRGEKIPLSWSLSQRSCNEMLKQFPKPPADSAAAADSVSGKAPGRSSTLARILKRNRDAIPVDDDEKTRRVIESNLKAKERLFDLLYPEK